MKRATWLDRALVVSPYYYTLCTTKKLFERALDDLKIPAADRPPFLSDGHCNATIHTFDTPKGDLSAILCLPVNRKASREQVAGLITHEAMHLWRSIREHLGEREPSVEFEAYAVQSITQRFLEEYKRQTVAGKSKKK